MPSAEDDKSKKNKTGEGGGEATAKGQKGAASGQKTASGQKATASGQKGAASGQKGGGGAKAQPAKKEGGGGAASSQPPTEEGQKPASSQTPRTAPRAPARDGGTASGQNAQGSGTASGSGTGWVPNLRLTPPPDTPKIPHAHPKAKKAPPEPLGTGFPGEPQPKAPPAEAAPAASRETHTASGQIPTASGQNVGTSCPKGVGWRKVCSEVFHLGDPRVNFVIDACEQGLCANWTAVDFKNVPFLADPFPDEPPWVGLGAWARGPGPGPGARAPGFGLRALGPKPGRGARGPGPGLKVGGWVGAGIWAPARTSSHPHPVYTAIHHIIPRPKGGHEKVCGL